ncbi:MAG: bifunctional 4-hydroxy-2-oxoglutarate aldolase/2-dehydro-3-deoxy-phosphogluconate aldolase [Prolixibacteraceae bacterium]|jgi:2-dehydro-3-deoxyphosphogluconate aldolase / (4S)-4-hydroxy-2-oxoglutarate aldolase|nr:bifunctional 4-hydroxy-2-oxoglutarate aldolase/2-dehydro-3-deoxy-phosphogluconate aldolase [Prolixibacteraceae bacterium]MBT6766706.1 bifunctional 4-hydroxy-2-oxoglutarate aldolase/2-dehydro-3-deoxy-phosphogluconate aldolase [Prolixibacteraceae bacterium]MBT7000688.1 bifunctional 4-hydroxy-2-oxoglutarate aldolase/2-dehydro-3-deoxy-phosphogluconate aldolase [Prolixibacteraceae bacterium]MBT7396142.1 bifunctional 4-hydroxy-2-oxoglutarate aldolase/2-dehydro-3-deoxy-phosphogluconate aldolase [Pro
MARFTRIEVALKMKETGMIPVFYNSDIKVCKNVVKACYEGGVRVFEFTNRGDFASLVFAELNKWAIEECPEMIMGVGSVIDQGTAAMYIALGANFIVSPLIDEGTAKVCNKRKVSWSPGCGSVTEIGRAHELGAEVVKIFPGSQVGGPGFVKAVLGPMPWTSIMPTGGVSPTEDNLKAWFEAGATCVGMGSQLFPKEIMANENYSYIQEKCIETLLIIKKYKK